MVCQNVPKEKSWDKPRQECHDEPREEQHEDLGGYTDYVSVQECKSVNVPVCSPVHHESYQDVTGQISKLVPIDRNAIVNQEMSVIRFQRRSTTVYPGSNVLK